LDPRQTTSDEPSNSVQGQRSELLALVRSVRGHVEELEASGAWGLPAALVAPMARGSTGPAPTRVAAAPSAQPSDAALAAAPAEPRGSPASVSVRELTEPAEPTAPGQPAGVAGARRLVHLPQASIDRLRELATEASGCTRCGLHEGRSQSVFARGGGSSGIVFVGEGPGEEEDRQGLPFVGPAGLLLDRMIAAMQLGRDDVYVCNIVKCRPPKNRKPEPDEMARCMPFLDEQLSIIAPRVIIALGATAVQGLLGTTEGITRLRGHWKLWRGKVPVMPTFHPAYLLRTPQAKRDVWKDLQEVLRHLGADAT
jgi:uracil-DNA glycosylase family 4